MVVALVKHGNADAFLFETTCKTSNDDLIRDLTTVWNKRLIIERLAGAAMELGKHGLMKEPEKQGIDSVQEQAGEIVEKGEFYNPDPCGYRTGNGPGPQLLNTIERVCVDAVEYIAPKQVMRKQALTLQGIQEKIDNVRGAVTMAYPMGLPEYDTVRHCLEDGVDALAGQQASLDVLDPDTATLWMAGKEFQRGQTVGDRCGRNEKTKVIVKLTKPNSGPPGREAAVSEDERKAMMAHYFKKQEEMKRLADAEDDDYLASAWANPNSLKQSMRGTSGINWRPM